MVGATRRQQEALSFIRDYIADNGGTSPSFEDIRIAMGFKSKSAVHRVVHSLAERGQLVFLRNQARSIALPKPRGDVSFTERDARIKVAAERALAGTISKQSALTFIL